MQKIFDALAQFDHSDDKFWTDDGCPKTGMVRRLCNDQTIKREDILKAAPDFRRNADLLADAHDDTAVVQSVADAQAENHAPLSVAQAQRAVVESQVRLRTAIDKQRDARGHVARAVAHWQQAIGTTYTPEQAARDFIATSIAERAAGHVRRRQPRVLRSVVDATAAAYNTGSRGGGGNAFRRGARDIHSLGRR